MGGSARNRIAKFSRRAGVVDRNRPCRVGTAPGRGALSFLGAARTPDRSPRLARKTFENAGRGGALQLAGARAFQRGSAGLGAARLSGSHGASDQKRGARSAIARSAHPGRLAQRARGRLSRTRRPGRGPRALRRKSGVLETIGGRAGGGSRAQQPRRDRHFAARLPACALTLQGIPGHLWRTGRSNRSGLGAEPSRRRRARSRRLRRRAFIVRAEPRGFSRTRRPLGRGRLAGRFGEPGARAARLPHRGRAVSREPGTFSGTRAQTGNRQAAGILRLLGRRAIPTGARLATGRRSGSASPKYRRAADLRRAGQIRTRSGAGAERIEHHRRPNCVAGRLGYTCRESNRGRVAKIFLRFLFGSTGIDQATHGGNAISGEAAFFRVLANQRFVGREVNTVQLVAGDVALQPLNFRAQFLQHRDGCSRRVPNFGIRHVSDAGYFSLDDEFRHMIASVLRNPNTKALHLYIYWPPN